MLFFDSKSLNQQWTNGEVVGTRYGLSSSGWVDTKLFKSWLKNPDVIDHGVPANDDSKPSNSNSSQKAPLDAVTSCQLPLGAIDSEHFHQNKRLFQKQYEEQYDLPDPVYQQWLKINHPTTELVKESQMIKVADPELSLEQEQEQEEYDDFPDPFADWPQEDKVEFLMDLTQEAQVEFAPDLSQEDQVEF